MLLEHAAKVANLAVGVVRPFEEAVEIADQVANVVAIHFKAEVAPTSGFDRAEIIVGDIKAAYDDTTAVGERKLLVVAQQIAPPKARAETAAGAVGVGEGREEILMAVVAAEPVDQKSYLKMGRASRREREVQ